MLLAFQFRTELWLSQNAVDVGWLELWFAVTVAGVVGRHWFAQPSGTRDLFGVMKGLGALYLAYLGVQTWRKAVEPLAGSVGALRSQPAPAKLFQTGMAVSAF